MCLPAGVIHLLCLHLHSITLKTIGSLLIYAFSIPTLTKIFFKLLPVEIFIPVTLMARQCPVNRPFAARYSWVQNPHAREQEMPCEKTNTKKIPF